ncbi:MAG: hypothetical protein JNL67_07915 [Planctomycetaceae bacterium]|nr:hypothetical protein [Planctomycetaceae bacterium]
MRWLAIVASFGGLMLLGGFARTFSKPTSEFQFSVQDDAPRLADGRIDFLAKLNRSLGDGVSPEDNAVVALLDVFGMRALKGIDQETFSRELGLKQVPNVRPLFVTWKEQAETLGFSPGSPAYVQWGESIEYTCQELWTAEGFPDVDGWIEVNQQAVAQVVNASQRPRFYFPLFPPKNGPEGESNVRMLEMSLEFHEEIKEIGRVLVIRALRQLAADDIDSAIRDIQTARRLASLQTQSLTTLELLISMNLSRMALGAEIKLLQSGKLSLEQCQAYRRFLTENPLKLELPKRFVSAERFLYLDAIQTLERGEAANLNFRLKLTDLDLAVFEQRASSYDSFAQAWAEPNDRARLEQVQEMEAELNKAVNSSRDIGRMAAAFLSTKARSRMVADMLLATVAPTYSVLADIEIRQYTSRDLLEVALAMEMYRLANGKFPESLPELHPEYLREIPKDRYTDQPLAYRRIGAGYRLYSVGKNQKDDLGQTQSDSENADDWGIAIGLRTAD